MKNIQTPIREIIRLNIILNRKELNMTQKELGSKLGLKKNTVASWEQGLSTPNIDTLVMMLDLFDVDFYDFVGIPRRKA